MHELIRFDVCDVDRVQQVADHVGYVDILINNAGCNLGGDPADMVKTDNMQKMVLTNYLAPMAFVAAFAPLMKQRGSGHIINIVSTAANDIYPNSSVYCSTKAALAAYTTAARHDLVDTPIRVTSISPGLVDTPLHEKKCGSLEQSRKTFDSIVPLYAEDVADHVEVCRAGQSLRPRSREWLNVIGMPCAIILKRLGVSEHSEVQLVYRLV